MKTTNFLSFFVYILYTFGTDFRHNYFDCDKKSDYLYEICVLQTY